MNRTDAEQILREAREFFGAKKYKDGVKTQDRNPSTYRSGNKHYEGESNSDLIERQGNANGFAKSFKSHLPGMTIYQIGEKLHTIYASGGGTGGNCGEQAAYVVYLLINKGVSSDNILYMTSYAESNKANSFGHSFCVVKTPAMTEGKPFVIDPWANLVCEIGDYGAALKKKFEDWHRKGKRIYVGTAWLDPADSRIVKITDHITSLGDHKTPTDVLEENKSSEVYEEKKKCVIM